MSNERSREIGEKPPRRALTVRGLMVLVGLLGVFSGLVAYSVRIWYLAPEEARRARCANNLHQIGLSIAEYSRQPILNRGWGYGVYPSGTIPNRKFPPADRCGWASLIYLGNDEGCSGCPMVYTEMAWNDPRQEGASGRDYEMFCPSAIPKRTLAKPLVPAAFIGIAGLGLDAPSLPKGDPKAGIFGDDRVVAPRDVKDGLAQTMMVAESSVPAGPWFAGARNTVRGLDPGRQPYIGVGRQFGGNHGEGANVLMADGSVRFVRDSIEPKVFEALSTMAGGEAVPAGLIDE